MRTLWFFSISAVAFFSILALSWNYKIVVDVRSAPVGDGALVCAQTLSYGSPFSGFEDGTDMLLYEPGKGFRALDFDAVRIVAAVAAEGGLLLFFPDSYGLYRLDDEGLHLQGGLNYYPQGEETAALECVEAVGAGDSVAVFFGAGGEEGGYRLLCGYLKDGILSEPLPVGTSNADFASVSAASNGKDIVVIWRTLAAPREIHWAMRTDGEWSLRGMSKNVNWSSSPFPVFWDGVPSLCYRPGAGRDFVVVPLSAGGSRERASYLRVDAQISLTAVSRAGRFAFGTDGVRIVALESSQEGYAAAGEPIEVGNAALSPEAMVLAEQLILIAVLMAFSFLLAGRGYARGATGIYPANLILRFSAFALDSLLTGAAAAIVFAAYLSVLGVPLRPQLLSLDELRLLQYLASVFLIVYGTFFEFFSLRTPGKRLFGLMVVSLKGGRPRFLAVFVRNLMKPVDFLLSAMFITPLIMLFTPLHQRIGDFLSHTAVISRPKAVSVVLKEPRISRATPPEDENDETDDDA